MINSLIIKSYSLKRFGWRYIFLQDDKLIESKFFDQNLIFQIQQEHWHIGDEVWN
jgi:hypothetical protein